MPTYPRNKRAAITSLFLYESKNILCYLLSKHTSLVIYFQNGNFWKYCKTKSDQNIHQNAPNCFIFLNILLESWVHALYFYSKRTAITSLFLYKNYHFIHQILSKCIICSMFSNFLGKLITIAIACR